MFLTKPGKRKVLFWLPMLWVWFSSKNRMIEHWSTQNEKVYDLPDIYIYPNLAPLSTQLTRMAQQGISFSEIGCNSALMTRCQKTADPDRYDTTSCFGGGMARKDSCILWRYGEDTSLSKSIVGAQQQPCKWVRIDMGKSCPRFMQVVKSYPVWDGLWPWPYSLGSLSLTSSRPSFRMIKPSPDSRAKRLCLLFRPAKVALCLSNCKLYGDYKAETWCQTQMSEGFWPPCSVRCLGIATWTSCGLTGDLPLFLCFLFLILQKKTLLSFDDLVAKLFASVIRLLVVSHVLVCCLS